MLDLTRRVLVAVLSFLIGIICYHFSSSYEHQTPVLNPKTVVISGAVIDDDFAEEATPSAPTSGLNPAILTRIRRSIKSQAPEYKFTAAFCTCPGLIANQKSYLFGTMDKGKTSVADLYIAEAASIREATKWMMAQRKSRAGVNVYGLGDEACQRKSLDVRSSTIWIRRRNVIVQVSGESTSVEILSQHVAAHLAAI